MKRPAIKQNIEKLKLFGILRLTQLISIMLRKQLCLLQEIVTVPLAFICKHDRGYTASNHYAILSLGHVLLK